MKRSALVTALLSLLFFLAVPNAVRSAEFSLEVNTIGDLSTCPTILGSPLTEDDIAVHVRNLGPQTDTFLLSLELPSREWSGFVRDSITLASGEQTTRPLSLFITVPDVEPGIYTITVQAESAITGDGESEAVDIEVLRCHDVALAIEETQQVVCTEDSAPVVYELEMTNFGKETETFMLSAIQDDNAVSWATFSPSEVTLDPEDSATITLTLSPPDGLVGPQDITLEARSTTSFASDRQAITVDLQDCYSMDAQLTPTKADVCIGRSGEYTLTLTNTGRESDIYFIEGPAFATLGAAEIELDAGEEETVTIIVEPDQIGEIEFSLGVASFLDPLLEKTLTATVVGEECRGVAVILSPVEGELCSGPEAEVSLLLKNTGTVEDTFRLSSPHGRFDQNEIALQPSETVQLTFLAATEDMEGTHTIEVTATSIHSSRASDRDALDLMLRNCYAAQLTVIPPSQEICQLEKPFYLVTAENTGEFEDTYIITVGDEIQQFTLDAGESLTINFAAKEPYAESGKFVAPISLQSEHGVETAVTAEVVVKEYAQCYLVDVASAEETKDIAFGEAVELMVSNRGDAGDAYTISVDGPAWVYFSPEEFTLEGHQQDSLFLFFSPPADTPEGAYEATVSVESDVSRDELALDMIVLPDSRLSVSFRNTEESLIIGATDGQNDGLTGFLTAASSGTGKTIALSVIIVVILIILVIRFLLFFKE